MKKTILAALTGILLSLPAAAEQPQTDINHCNGRVENHVSVPVSATPAPKVEQKAEAFTPLRTIKLSSIKSVPVADDATQPTMVSRLSK